MDAETARNRVRIKVFRGSDGDCDDVPRPFIKNRAVGVAVLVVVRWGVLGKKMRNMHAFTAHTQTHTHTHTHARTHHRFKHA